MVKRDALELDAGEHVAAERSIVSSPFRYCAACETAFWRSQFLNQPVCVTATPAPMQDDD